LHFQIVKRVLIERASCLARKLVSEEFLWPLFHALKWRAGTEKSPGVNYFGKKKWQKGPL